MPLISNKREFLARSLRSTGILALIERSARRPGLLALVYHRIGDPACHSFYARIASATPEGFRAELSALARTRRVITLEEALEIAADDRPLAEPLALITFDDGYRDNVDACAPRLERARLARGVFSHHFLRGWNALAVVGPRRLRGESGNGSDLEARPSRAAYHRLDAHGPLRRRRACHRRLPRTSRC